MRTIGPAPASFLDPGTRVPHFGSFAGTLPKVIYPAGFGARLLRRKRWVYLAITSRDVWISMAIVRTGYAATAFAFAYDLTMKRMLDDVSVMGLSAFVDDDPHGVGPLATFSFGKTSLAFERSRVLSVRAKIGKIEIEAALEEGARICAIADLGPGLFDATEKEAPMRTTGAATIGGRRFDLTGALACVDYTHGHLPRHTKWRWAFGLGESNGAPVGFNFVSGFVGEAECALFSGNEVTPLAEPQFSFGEPLGEWTLKGEGIDLSFMPGAMHAEYKNLGLIKSKFLQPVGTFSGTIGDRRFDALPGVVEDQDVLW